MALDPPSSIDPPEEEEMESTPRESSSSFPSSFLIPPRSRGLHNHYLKYHVDADDDNLDEFELEGLVMTSNTCSCSLPFSSSTRTSSVGSKMMQSNALSAHDYLVQHCLPMMALCSLAWNPQNRSRSAIALLAIALLCMTILMKNDVIAWRRSFLSHTSKKFTKVDPLSNLTVQQRQSLLKSIYGTYTFYDGSAEDRPKDEYMTIANAGNIYLDLPVDKFPPESWQADAVYANHFLDASEKLVKRAQQAIYATYHGHGISDIRVVSTDNGEDRIDYIMEDADVRSSQRSKMFHLEEVDLRSVKSTTELNAAAPLWDKKGGWTTQRSYDGLKRRMKHAMMTNSNFTVVVTGNWQSMGYGGNHAWQSMAGVFETLLKGLFNKLGVTLVVRTIGLPPLTGLSREEEVELAKGGRSTFIHALGWSSIYGSDVDMIVWDDYSIDGDDVVRSPHDLDEFGAQLFDFFARQALLSGTSSLPFLWGGDFTVLRNLHEHADADIGQLGDALLGIPETSSMNVADELPWAAQYLNCSKAMQRTCENEKYLFESHCWIEQTNFTPSTAQLDKIPILKSALGWRMHQLKGYTLSYIMLAATLDALFEWSDVTISLGFPLPDEDWHMGKHIQNVQSKIRSLNETAAPHCFQLESRFNLPKRLCSNKMRGRTQYTPRADPSKTSIRSIIDPAQVLKMEDLFLDGFDTDQVNGVPRGEVDALEIFELQGKRRLLQKTQIEQNKMSIDGATSDYTKNIHEAAQKRRRLDAIVPGEGWEVLNGFGDECDGSLSSTFLCGRLPSSNCLFEGHQGSRGGIWGNETTEWLVLHSIRTENGYIAINLEFDDRNKSRQENFDLLPNSFVLEYSVDGVITTLHKSFFQKLKQPVPGMILVQVLNEDKAYDQAKDFTIALRMKGCTNNPACQIALTHVYWS